MEDCEYLHTDAKLAGKLLALAIDFRRQAAEPDVPQELRVELVATANSLCETALYILKKG